MLNFPFHFPAKARLGNEGHVVFPESSPHIGELGLQVQAVDGVHIHGSFAAIEEGVSGSISIHLIAFQHFAGFLGKDIIPDAVTEKGRHYGKVRRVEIQSQVSLEAVFRLQVFVPHLIAHRSFVDPVRAQFAQVRGAEAAGYIGPEVQGGDGRINHAGAAGDAPEAAAEVCELAVKSQAVQGTEIGPQSTAEMELAQVFGGGGKEAGIQEPVGGDEHFFP